MTDIFTTNVVGRILQRDMTIQPGRKKERNVPCCSCKHKYYMVKPMLISKFQSHVQLWIL